MLIDILVQFIPWLMHVYQIRTHRRQAALSKLKLKTLSLTQYIKAKNEYNQLLKTLKQG